MQEALFDAPAPSAAGDAARGDAGPPADGVPLAERLRPHSIDEVVGQRALLGPGRPLRAMLEGGRLHSMILWGPPGVGKTTLARLLAGACDADFIALSAVLAGVRDIRDAVERAEAARARGRRTVVLVDEVHRFNKAQQDAFLPHVESGLLTFVGATTENPSFEVNAALLSRATVHVLEPLADEDLAALIDRAQAALGAPPLTEAARRRLVAHADGDARRLLNAYENLLALAGGRAELDEPALEAALGAMLRRYDKGGGAFYDAISALHKAVRGSDPDAALYWLARMLDGGTDPRYVARRVLRMASEDIGLADPRALQIALAAAETYERLGSPEGELALAEAVVFLAVVPKSNAVYEAWNAARDFVAADGSRPVPMHLRNAPTKLMKSLGHGAGYRYAHDEDGGYAAGESYWPDSLAPRRWYEPRPRGLEQRIAERLAELRTRDVQAGSRGGGEDGPRRR
ncbi:MAG: replication-associated recombination protein A [Burkholderiales bacterium]|nr:replication-associated recombination protein A [Burkholderiales bacterium]